MKLNNFIHKFLFYTRYHSTTERGKVGVYVGEASRDPKKTQVDIWRRRRITQEMKWTHRNANTAKANISYRNVNEFLHLHAGQQEDILEMIESKTSPNIDLGHNISHAEADAGIYRKYDANMEAVWLIYFVRRFGQYWRVLGPPHTRSLIRKAYLKKEMPSSKCSL